MKRHLTNIDEHLGTMIRVIIWKQWKVPSKREWGLKKLGVNKNLARLTAYCGNRYQWVVTKTCVVRAISKEKLTKKGLVSCIDYYNSRRHNLGLNWTAVCRTACTVVWEEGENPSYSIVWRACHNSMVKVQRGVVADEPDSDLQVSHREVWERRSNSEIVVWRTETWY